MHGQNPHAGYHWSTCGESCGAHCPSSTRNADWSPSWEDCGTCCPCPTTHYSGSTSWKGDWTRCPGKSTFPSLSLPCAVLVFVEANAFFFVIFLQFSFISFWAFFLFSTFWFVFSLHSPPNNAWIPEIFFVLEKLHILARFLPRPHLLSNFMSLCSFFLIENESFYLISINGPLCCKSPHSGSEVIHMYWAFCLLFLHFFLDRIFQVSVFPPPPGGKSPCMDPHPWHHWGSSGKGCGTSSACSTGVQGWMTTFILYTNKWWFWHFLGFLGPLEVLNIIGFSDSSAIGLLSFKKFVFDQHNLRHFQQS